MCSPARITDHSILFKYSCTKLYLLLLTRKFSKLILTGIYVKEVSMIRVDFGPISETVYIDIILNTIIER